jgi:signal transduction histidine kinase
MTAVGVTTLRDERFEALLGAAAPIVTAIFDALPDGLGVLWPVRDEHGAILDFEIGYTNPSGTRLMGVPLDREVGTRVRDVLPGLVEIGHYDRLVRVANTGITESEEAVLDTMWRDTIAVRGVWIHTVLPFGDGVISAAFDVTDQRRRETELRDFAAVAAHDLREPLIGIQLMAGLLAKREALGPKEHEMVALLGDGVERARGLVDSILEYATADGESAARAEVDCAAVAGEVVASLASQIERASGRVEIGELPVVSASRQGVARVFQNLIANALKFHDGSDPVVVVSAAEQDGAWAFSVRDNGIGLPEGSPIFEMFTRGSGDHEGSGIGLATCRRIVEGHGGRIWAEAAPGGGSTFTFTLPA